MFGLGLAIGVAWENKFTAFGVQGEEKFCVAVPRRKLGFRGVAPPFGDFNLNFPTPNLPRTLYNLDHPYVHRTNFGTVVTAGT